MAMMIGNSSLTRDAVPPADASWEEIERFARSYDAYKVWGSLEACGSIANARDTSTLDKARTCLFFEWRRWRHLGSDPDPAAMAYIRDVLERIRVQVPERHAPPQQEAPAAAVPRSRLAIVILVVLVVAVVLVTWLGSSWR